MDMLLPLDLVSWWLGGTDFRNLQLPTYLTDVVIVLMSTKVYQKLIFTSIIYEQRWAVSYLVILKIVIRY